MENNKPTMKTLTVTIDTWNKLTKLKYEKLFDSIDDVISYLLENEVKDG